MSRAALQHAAIVICNLLHFVLRSRTSDLGLSSLFAFPAAANVAQLSTSGEPSLSSFALTANLFQRFPSAYRYRFQQPELQHKVEEYRMPWTLIPRTSFLVGKRLAWGPAHASRLHTEQQAYAIERSRFQPKRTDSQMSGKVDYSQGKLCARPGQAAVDQSPPLLGLQPLGTGARRDGLIYTPKSYQHGRPSPLCVIMHGAGGNAKGALFAPLEDIAEKVLLPFAMYAVSFHRVDQSNVACDRQNALLLH